MDYDNTKVGHIYACRIGLDNKKDALDGEEGWKNLSG